MRRGRLLFSLIVLLATAAAAHAISGRGAEDHVRRARSIPLAFAGWTGADEDVSARVFVVLETEDVIVRRYSSGDRSVTLAVAASSDDRKVTHPPEVCLRAAGYEVSTRERVEVPGLTDGAIRLVARRGDRVEQVLYWFVVDGRCTSSYLGHQIDASLNRLTGRSSGAALVRISSDSSAGDVLDLLREFAGDLVPELERVIR